MNRRKSKKQSRKRTSKEIRSIRWFEFSVDLKSMDNLWLNQRLKILENSLEFIEKDETMQVENEIEDEFGCARCRIYQRKQTNERDLFRQIKQFHREHNYSNSQVSYSTPG